MVSAHALLIAILAVLALSSLVLALLPRKKEVKWGSAQIEHELNTQNLSRD